MLFHTCARALGPPSGRPGRAEIVVVGVVVVVGAPSYIRLNQLCPLDFSNQLEMEESRVTEIEKFNPLSLSRKSISIVGSLLNQLYNVLVNWYYRCILGDGRRKDP